MTTICNSCGKPISSSGIVYKCRQCVHHFVCQSCAIKSNKQANDTVHTYDKIVPPKIQITATTNAKTSSESNFDVPASLVQGLMADIKSILSISDNNLRQNQPKISSKPSSIFNSDGYLYGLLGCCFHCYRIVIMDKEPSFQCQQCPNGFGVCAECMPLMTTHHPSMHTFSKQPLSHWTKTAHDLYHLDITCNACSIEGFNGKRYQCEECSPSYDLCENCVGQKHTHHKMKYIQNPCLYSANQQVLGLRTVELGKRNGGNNVNWRDSITGWTQSDGELAIQKGKQEQENYETRLQDIVRKNEQYAEEQRRRNQRLVDDAQRRLQDTIDDSWRSLSWNM